MSNQGEMRPQGQSDPSKLHNSTQAEVSKEGVCGLPNHSPSSHIHTWVKTDSINGNRSEQPSSQPTTTSTAPNPLQALTFANLAALNRCYNDKFGNLADILTAYKLREKNNVACKEYGVEVPDCCVPGQHQGKTPMENWVESRCDPGILSHCSYNGRKEDLGVEEAVEEEEQERDG
ncbi:uncharacterized protein BDR25DRAFT_345956 [Lindgomyces ingoldianus]|uniref:Uncharacterized protein n=1 Tax=Lindgomyces ingoldianus TaxID=673940 RepID=A0ACB6QFP1_9PLEO|nr:uncharacterized protein BDR25DRAFT_345956 [Lindgomyces ingoldianus]KAF2465793.1 hypothetical protein BDR25DRAFT_345956 [Lindgomyces ingoldianus]